MAYIILHTCELHEADDCVNALPYPLISDSHSLDVFTSRFNIPENICLMLKSKQPTIHHYAPL